MGPNVIPFARRPLSNMRIKLSAALPCGAYGTIRGVEDRVGSHTCCSLLELLPAMLPAFLINDRFARFAIVQFPASL